MDIYHDIEHVYGATLSMGNSEDKNSSILAYNSGLKQDMKFKVPLLSFSQSKDYSCISFIRGGTKWSCAPAEVPTLSTFIQYHSP